MAATFRRAVLDQPGIASMVFEFQFGLYEDVRVAFLACDDLVEFNAEYERYFLDVSFTKTFARDVVWARKGSELHASYYCLLPKQRDDRLPLHVAIYQGYVELTKRMLRCRPDLATKDAIVLALQKCRLEIAAFLLDERATMPALYRTIPCTAGGTPSFVPSISFCDVGHILAREDSQGVLLLQRFGEPPHFVVSAVNAIQQATRENLTLALDLFPWLYFPALLDYVAGRGFLPLVRSLHERGLECSTGAMDKAAASGHVEVVRFLHVHRSEGCTIKAMDDAAANGHLEVVQFLHFNRAEGCSRHALEKAVDNDHLDVVRFLLDHRTERASRELVCSAIAKGHLEIVQYLHSLGSLVGSGRAIDRAAAAGHLDVVRFVLTHGSERCSDSILEEVFMNGHASVAAYLLSLGYPSPTSKVSWTSDTFSKPEMRRVLELYLSNGGQFDNDWVQLACAGNNLPLVQFLHEHPLACCTHNPLGTAINVKAWNVMPFLVAHCTTAISFETFQSILYFGDLDMATHLLQRYPEYGLNRLLKDAADGHYTDLSAVTRFLLAAGIGNPRKCLRDVAGRRECVTASKILLPYCMDPTNSLANVIFLLDLLTLPRRRGATIRQLITPELAFQGRKASKHVQVDPSVAVRATTLLDSGHVVDWALANLIGHLYATDETVAMTRLTEWKELVEDAELKAQLNHLLGQKRPTRSD